MVGCACVTCITVHVTSSRLLPHQGTYRSFAAGSVAGLAALAALSATMHASAASHLVNLTIYLCFVYVFFHFNNMGETARRIRLIGELLDEPNGLTYVELVARYNAREIIDRRIDRMVGSGQLRIEGERFVAAQSSFLMMAHCMRLLKRILNVPPA